MGESELVRLETNDWRQADRATDTVASFAAILNSSGCQEHGRRSSRDNCLPELADWQMPVAVLTSNAGPGGTGAVDGDEETRRCAWHSLYKGHVLRLNKGWTRGGSDGGSSKHALAPAAAPVPVPITAPTVVSAWAHV